MTPDKKKVGWVEGEMITVCWVPEVDMYDAEEPCQNAYGVECIAVDGTADDYYVINVMQTAFIDWATVDAICIERA